MRLPVVFSNEQEVCVFSFIGIWRVGRVRDVGGYPLEGSYRIKGEGILVLSLVGRDDFLFPNYLLEIASYRFIDGIPSIVGSLEDL